MAVIFERVKPGQLIKADFMNHVLDEVERLGRAMEGLVTTSGGARLVLYDISPQGDVRVGQRLTVLGSNFLVPGRLNEVKVDGVSVPQSAFTETGDQTHLVFDVPIFGVPSGRKDTSISVKNQFGDGTLPIHLLPELNLPQGRIELDYTSAPILPTGTTTIGAGTFVFILKAKPFVDKEATYDVKVTVPDQPTWSAVLYQDTADAPRTSNRILIAADPVGGVAQQLRVAVIIPAVPAPAANAVGTLRVEVTETSSGSRILPATKTVPITVGQPPPAPATGAHISGRGLGAGVGLDGSRVKFTAAGSISFTLTFERKGTYSLEAKLAAGTGWTLTGPNPTGFDLMTDTMITFPVNRTASVILTPGTGGGNTDVLLTLKAPDANPPVDITFVQAISK